MIDAAAVADKLIADEVARQDKMWGASNALGEDTTRTSRNYDTQPFGADQPAVRT